MFSNNKQRLQLSYFGNNKIPKETKFPQEVTLENKIEIKIGHGDIVEFAPLHAYHWPYRKPLPTDKF